MPRTIDADFKTHLAGHVITTVSCLKIKRTDGEIFAFTELDADLEIDLDDGDGAVVYSASNASTLSAVETQSGLKPDNLSIEGGLSANFIDMADIRNGLFFGAECTLFICNWSSGTLDYETGVISNLTQAPVIIDVYEWGEANLRDFSFAAELRPLTDRYNQRVGKLTSPLCRHGDVGDSLCQVRLVPPTWQSGATVTVRQSRDAGTGSVVKPTVENGFHYKCTTGGTTGGVEPTWGTVLGGTTNDNGVVWTAIKALSQTGTVSAVTDTRNFTATGISLGADWWNYGVLEWLTGDNAGLKSEVKDDNGTGTLKLFQPAPNTIQVGDTFLVKKGCDRRLDTCKVFDNVYNRDAEDFMPGVDVALDYPDAS